MEKHTRGIVISISFTVLLFVSSFTLFADNPPSAAYTVKNLNEQSVMALAWVQNSAEYRELCYQAYNIAGMLVNQAVASQKSVMALAWVQNSAEYRELCYQAYNIAGMMVNQAVASQKSGDKPLAIVADLDETLINNSAYDAGLVGRDAAYSGKTWTEWENAALARAMPGAAGFLQSVANKGVTVFYVTNRDKAGLAGTIENLKKLGYPFADTQHVLVKTTTSNKQPRFDTITQDYTVVVYMGDNTNDLPIGTYGKGQQARNAAVDQHKAEFGVKFIALPNPVYGDWEPALVAKGYWGLSAKGKDQARVSSLYTWVPPQN